MYVCAGANQLKRKLLTRVHIRAQVGTHFVTSRWPRAVHARVPATAASASACPCRLDGCSHTCRVRAPVQVRLKSRKAFEHRRYHRRELLVNRRRSSRRTDKVDQMSGALRLSHGLHAYPVPTMNREERTRPVHTQRVKNGARRVEISET